MKNRAFTLIELLVVVLIIGILAAIALPQYQTAVAKTRLTQRVISANSLLTAVSAYRLANNTWPGSLDELDIDTGNICVFWVNHKGTETEEFVISCGNGLGYRITWVTNGDLYRYCWTNKADSVGNQVCKSMSGRSTYSSEVSDIWLYEL